MCHNPIADSLTTSAYEIVRRVDVGLHRDRQTSTLAGHGLQVRVIHPTVHRIGTRDFCSSGDTKTPPAVMKSFCLDQQSQNALQKCSSAAQMEASLPP